MRAVRCQFQRPAVALETTLVLHGVPRAASVSLIDRLSDVVRLNGAHPAFVGVFEGIPTVGLDGNELRAMLDAPSVPKANTSNLGVLIHRKQHAATTVSTTMELAASAGLSVFATGGLGGVHPGLASRLDISADLAALARFPVGVVCSGVKSILDVASTRELMETLGVPVVGYRTDEFPAFYTRRSGEKVDARFDDDADLARFIGGELARTSRAVVVVNPIPAEHEIDAATFEGWLEAASEEVARDPAGATGRDATPAMLGALHRVSGGRTLGANIALALDNAALAARLARLMHKI